MLQRDEATQVSIHRQIGHQNVAYFYDGMLALRRKETVQ